ncbi:hypothetical protein [Methylobacterium isbiliense]|uniref:Uncharacterized protein n=1 Tax=Methylobacterium isbiliense TaxID=315478 RepID=A0ABQ4SFI4_9HYPH|nr:hypothetical protein [Methylobacterium isbiliense]MDN3622577.1 hypothetical protein [Methylobacterium isbiliense]GJE00575.1 hypothetical protein GMJLKIPL_2498 [Methylobacterium isbiliense]
MATAYDPKHPSRPVPIGRIVECTTYAIKSKPLGYWSYLARFGDNDAFKVDPWRWVDIPEAMEDGLELLADLARLAALMPGGERRVREVIHEKIAQLEAAQATSGAAA